MAPTGPGRSPSRLQTVAIVLGVLVIAGGVAAASFLVKPSKARSFQLFERGGGRERGRAAFELLFQDAQGFGRIDR